MAYQSWMHVSTLLDSSNLVRVNEAFMAISRITMPILYFGQNTFEGVGSVILGAGCLIGAIHVLKRRITVSRDSLLAKVHATTVGRTIGFGYMLVCSLTIMIG